MSAGLPLFLRKALTLAFTYCITKSLNLMKGKLHDVCCHDEQTEQIAISNRVMYTREKAD